MASPAKQIARELVPLVRVYTDGSVERFHASAYEPPSPIPDPITGVSSKNITISQNPQISARLYLPKIRSPHQKLPILVYFHGSAFCVESAFSSIHHRYMNTLVAEANVIAVAVEYRLAPEHPLPAAYDDSWAALNWVASHSVLNSADKDPWLSEHGDLEKLYIGGDSAGGNIVHNMAMRAGSEKLKGDVKIVGAYVSQSYFWGSEPIGSEKDPNKRKPYVTPDSITFASDAGLGHERSFPSLVWEFVYPSAPGGLDNPMLNPEGPGAPSLEGLGCSKLLVVVAGEDELRDRGVRYYELVKQSGWKGEVEFHEDEGEPHGFHALYPDSEKAKNLIKRFAAFLK